jgi:DNA-binding CsgD family transcriptional regulator/sugar-specific transcriptional regulator TrmB
MFESLGLDVTTEAVYRALLTCPDAGVAEIAGQLVLPEEEVRGALDRLSELGLLHPSSAEEFTGRPLAPGAGLTSLLNRSQAELAERMQRIERTRSAISQISDEYQAANTHELALERLESGRAVRDRLIEFAQNCRTECLTLVPGGAQTEAAMLASRPLDQLVLDRGVRLRSVYQESFRNDRPTLEYVSWLHDMGGETRTTPELPLPMIIVDGEHALLPLDRRDAGVGAIQIASTGLVAALVELFDLIWASSVPFGKHVVRDENEISAQERALLFLLAEGCTDQLAARRLGVSLRTIRRMTATLLHRLNAQTRFQAAATAARRGWL